MNKILFYSILIAFDIAILALDAITLHKTMKSNGIYHSWLPIISVSAISFALGLATSGLILYAGGM